MRVKIWASPHPSVPDVHSNRMLDVVERNVPYVLGDETHYGLVVGLAPLFDPSDGIDQNVIVRANYPIPDVRPQESLLENQQSSYEKLEYFPILIDKFLTEGEAPKGTYELLENERLSIEDVSKVLTSDAFALWRKDCFLSHETIKALQSVTYAIAYRYSTETERDSRADSRAKEFVNLAVACLSLIRPTRKTRTGNVTGRMRENGTFEPQSFRLANHAEVPEVQQLFAIRNQDIELLRLLLPEFINVYSKDGNGSPRDEYEPIRMAIQLYEQAYSITHWKPRHILWWAAIEALYGNNEQAAVARIYALFGNGDLETGYRCSIYEKGDIPSFFPRLPSNDHTLGEVVPLIYAVRNESAHGQRVPDLRFAQVPHPLNKSVPLVEVLAEAATFIIRRTIIEIMRRGLLTRFVDKATRDDFWLMEYGLNGSQSKKRLRELEELLGQGH